MDILKAKLYTQISQSKYFPYKTGTQFIAKHCIPKQKLWHIFLLCCNFINAFKVIMKKNALMPVKWFGVEEIYFQNFRIECYWNQKNLYILVQQFAATSIH